MRLVVIAEEGYLFDELTDHTGTRADISTAITMNGDYSATTASVRPSS